MTTSFSVDATIYINLDHRTDRKEEIEKELSMIGISKYERFSAIRTFPGIIGCGDSHLNVLKLAKERGYKNILIIEDDFEFLIDKDSFWKLMNDVFTELPEYDIVMLGYNLKRSVEVEGLQHVIKVLEAQTTSAYIIHSNMYDALINVFEQSQPLLISTGQHWNYALDQAWKVLQPNSKWYATKVRVGKQRPSLSDGGMEPVFCDTGM